MSVFSFPPHASLRRAKIISKFHLSNLNKDRVAAANLEGDFVSALQADCFVGSLAAWWVADAFGRRKAMILAAFLAFVRTVIASGEFGHSYCDIHR